MDPTINLIYDINFDISSNINNIGFDTNNDLILLNVYNKVSDKELAKILYKN